MRFDDFSTFAKNRVDYLDVVQEPDTLLQTIDEIGVFTLDKSKAVALKSFGPSNLTDYLIGHSNIGDSYQGYQLYTFSKPDFLNKQLAPVITSFKTNHWSVLDNYFVFAENLNTLQTIIANKNNNTTFNKNAAYTS